jgi:phosphoglycolate phosphatase
MPRAEREGHVRGSEESKSRELPMVVFDFDGTIADSWSEMYSTYVEIAEDLGLPRLTMSEISALGRMTPAEILRTVTIPLWKMPRVVSSMRETLRKRIDAIRPFPNIHEAIQELRRAGCPCGILSSNSRENVNLFLERYGIHEFETISCGVSPFGKAAWLRRLQARAARKSRFALYIGDEVRDVLAANRAGVKSIAVSWGYGDRSALVSTGADFVVDHPLELAPLVLSVGTNRDG